MMKHRQMAWRVTIAVTFVFYHHQTRTVSTDQVSFFFFIITTHNRSTGYRYGNKHDNANLCTRIFVSSRNLMQTFPWKSAVGRCHPCGAVVVTLDLLVFPPPSIKAMNYMWVQGAVLRNMLPFLAFELQWAHIDRSDVGVGLKYMHWFVCQRGWIILMRYWLL